MVTMKLTINGEARQLEAGTSVAALMLQLGVNTTQVAVERNGGIVPRSAYGEMRLADGDAIEIVHFIGGG